MKRFIIFYTGHATPPDASHAGWPEWFDQAGDALADRGSALVNGLSVAHGVATPSGLAVNGYSMLQAESLDELRPLIDAHPYLAQGNGYSIEVFELPS